MALPGRYACSVSDADDSGAGRSGAGRLTLVGTPIGNLGDLTESALRALREADVVCAEDTRRTRKLLSAYDIHPARLRSVRAQNEERESERVACWIAAGLRVAYVTDAGMPGISDPGQALAARVLLAEAPLAVAPGPDAASALLSLAGVRVDRWCFEGFLPVKGSQRAARVAAVAAEPRACVLYEAPHRLLRTLADLAAAAGQDREIVVANELTKRFERVWRGAIGTVLAEARQAEPRGEFVLMIMPAAPG